MNNNLRKVIVPCRFSYLHCFEPISVDGGELKYSVSAIIPKSDTKTIDAINNAVEESKKHALSKWGGQVPTNLKTPLRDGDVERPEDDVYKGCYFFNANTNVKPQVVDAKVQPILDESSVYSGCYGKISVTFYGYSVDGNYGIAAGLGNIQKIKDGEKLRNRIDAADEFEVVDEEDFLM